MTVNQMFIKFKLGVDKADSLNSPDFLPEEIDSYLSDAQEQFIEQQAYGNNIKGETIEETAQRTKALQDITINGNLNTFIVNANNKPNGTFVALPDGATVTDNTGVILLQYRHAIEEQVTLSYVDCNNVTQTIRVQVIPITHDKYNRIILSPFSQPNNNKVYRLPYGRIPDRNNQQREHFELILSPDQTLITYHLRYLFNPRKIDKAQILNPLGLAGTASGDLTDTSYREVISLAVRNAIGDLTGQNSQESIERLKEIA